MFVSLSNALAEEENEALKIRVFVRKNKEGTFKKTFWFEITILWFASLFFMIWNLNQYF